jgi:MFS family permease
VVLVSVITVYNSTMNSSLASNAAPYFSKEFHVSNEYLLILPTSLYLIGYCIGPILFGPLSEVN